MGNGITIVAEGQNAGDSDFRDWTRKLHNSILAVGMTDVSASGAITSGSDSSAFDALSRPAFGNTPAGFQIYRFSDALQSSLPVFIKIEFGTGAATARISTWATVGVAVTSASIDAEESNVTGSDPFTQRHQLAQSTNAANKHQWFVGGDTNYLTYTGPTKDLQDLSDGPGGFFFAVERTKNASGDDTADGILVGMVGAQSFYAWYSMPATGSVPSPDTELPTAIGTQNPATHQGRQIVSPVFPLFAVSAFPGRNILSCQDNSFRDLDIIPISIFAGKTDNYVKLTTNTASAVGNSSAGQILLRWT